MQRNPVDVAENAVTPEESAIELYAQGVEPHNRCDANCADNETLRGIVYVTRAGLTAKDLTRFFSKIQRSDGCWMWTSAVTRGGYGLFCAGRFPDGRQDQRYAHRVMRELTHGPIPTGMVVRHACDTPGCVRPDHLLIGSQGDNIRDAARQGKYAKPRPSGWTIPAEVRAEAIAARGYGAIQALANRTGFPMRTLAQIRRRALRKVA